MRSLEQVNVMLVEELSKR